MSEATEEEMAMEAIILDYIFRLVSFSILSNEALIYSVCFVFLTNKDNVKIYVIRLRKKCLYQQ